MPTQIEVIHKPDEQLAGTIRVLLCSECKTPNRNPLTETNFNAILQNITQEAFDAGRRFERKHPNLTV